MERTETGSSGIGVTPLADRRAADPEEIRAALARAVATRRIPADAVSAVAKRLAGSKYPISHIDVCTHGICIDYIFNDERWAKALTELVKAQGSRIHSMIVFPWGIPFPDIFRVRVEQDFDEFAGTAVHG